MHRAGPAGHGGAEGGSHILRDALAVVNQPGTFGHRSGHTHLVHLLEGGHTLFRQFGTAGDEDNRAFRGIDGGQTGDGVGESRAAGENRHRRFAGNAGIAVGHVHGGAFVASINKLNSFIGRRIHQGQDGIADDGKHPLNALLFQTADEQVASVQVGHKCLLLRC